MASSQRAHVRLNVYDMYWLNDYASNIGFGIFHSGIEIFGIEYAYGGHPYQFSGVFENSPQDADELGENFKFRESILVGETEFSSRDVKKLIKALGDEFRGDKYHLISRNCNHFSSVLARALTGKEIPTWINRLANISGSIPFLEKCLPQEWLTPVVLQNGIDEARRERVSIDSAEEATEVGMKLAMNDSRTTMINGHPAPSRSASSSSACSTASSNLDDVNTVALTGTITKTRSGSPPIFRFWSQLKATIGGSAPPSPAQSTTNLGGEAVSARF